MRARFLDGIQGSEKDLLSPEQLRAEGVYNDVLPVEDTEARQSRLQELCGQLGYTHQDEVTLRPNTAGLAQLCESFLREHRHNDDEVRFVLDGAGVFDVRSREDRWIRIEVERGDLLVVPAQRNHRFMLGEDQRIHCVRLFKDSAGWAPLYREAPSSE